MKITIAMVALMLTMAIGYATSRDTLKISGTANIEFFTIRYNLNGGTNEANPITTYNATTAALLPIPTYINHIFRGWYENDTFSGNQIITTPTRKSS